MKFIKPKNLVIKLLFVASVLSAAFLINSCRKDVVRSGSVIVSKTLAGHHIDIADLKKAYAEGTGSGKLKANDISNQAISSIVSTLNVDWSTYTLQEFADSSKIIEFAMPDDTSLIAPKDSLQAGNIKYKSKTSAVFILHKDTIILNFFMKTVEDLNDPLYQSVINEQFYLNTPANFNGQILYFTLDRQFINGYLWKGGSISKSITIGTQTTPPSPQTQAYKKKLKTDEVSQVNCTVDTYEYVWITTVTTPYGSTTTYQPTGQTFTVTTCTVADGGSAGTTGPVTGGVSGGAGTTPLHLLAILGQRQVLMYLLLKAAG